MRIALLLVSLASAVISVSCGSDSGNSNTTKANPCASKTVIVQTCLNAHGPLVYCENQDATEAWYLVCSSGECNDGERFDCPNRTCGSIATTAIDACNPPAG